MDLGILHFVVQAVFIILIIALFIRVILSWFRVTERNPFMRTLAYITDPVLAPARRLIPPIGMIDISYFVAWFALLIVEQLILQSLPVGW
jgi:YggT family protein